VPPSEREPRRPDYRVLLAAYERSHARYLAEPTAHHLELLLTGEELLAGQLFLTDPVALERTVATPGAADALRSQTHAPAAFLLHSSNFVWPRTNVRTFVRQCGGVEFGRPGSFVYHVAHLILPLGTPRPISLFWWYPKALVPTD